MEYKMKLTDEQLEILNGSKGEVMAKVMKTLVMYGDIFGAEKLVPITYKDENHVCIGDTVHRCTGPRIHVSSTGQIKDFYLVHRFLYDALNKSYLLVGCLGKENLDKLRHQ